MKNSVWKLKVMSGSHKGVELKLPYGKTTLGSDDLRADLVFDNQGLESVHLLLEITENDALYVSIVAENSALKLNGHTINNDSSEIHDSAVILTEKLVLAVVSGEKPWPEAEPTIEASEGVTALAENRVTPNEISKNDLSLDSASQGQSSFLSSIDLWKEKLSWKKFGIIATTLVLFSVTTVVGLYYGQAKSDTKVVLSSLEKGQQLLTRMNYTSVKLICNKKKKRLEISGYVETEREKRKLLTQLKSLGISYKGRVWVVERIVRSVNFTLEELGFKTVHAAAGDSMGTVVLRGAIESRERWPELEAILDNDIPGLDAWKVDFSTTEDRVEAFGKMLSAAGLESKLKLQGEGDTVKALGLLDKQEERGFYKTAEAYRQIYGNTPELQAFPRHLNTDSLPVKGINLSEDPFLVMENNQKYLVGAKLPNGYQVDKITSKGITMSRGSDTVYFSLESKSNEQRNPLDDKS